jgi:hypothetical protein
MALTDSPPPAESTQQYIVHNGTEYGAAALARPGGYCIVGCCIVPAPHEVLIDQAFGQAPNGLQSASQRA